MPLLGIVAHLLLRLGVVLWIAQLPESLLDGCIRIRYGAEIRSSVQRNAGDV